ncbi:MAG: VIT1/CCC1 transporter family protein [Rhodospirillales bacterium]|nr:VIT1/CCC1 transporter family protein [Rhodospirillales bacterium]
MAESPAGSLVGVLEPIDRISEILFGLIMVLTFTSAIGVLTAGDPQIRTLIIGAIGCNLAWGLIDGGVYLMARLNDRGRKLMTFRAVTQAADPAEAHRVIAGALPPLLAPLLSSEQLEAMRRQLIQLAAPPAHPQLSRRDWIGASAICLLSFLSTFPVIVPFLVIDDVRLALRTSNLVAMAMLFLCGYAYGLRTGLRPWATGLSMIAVGGVLVGIAIVLGG